MVLQKAIPKLDYFQNRDKPPKVDDLEDLFSQAIDEIWIQYDKDGNGTLNREETRKFVKQVMAQNGI